VPLNHAGKALAELKWANDNSIFEALWDAIKLADATQLPEVASVYLCCGAPEARWTKPVECAEIFDTGACEIVNLIREHNDLWGRYILADSTGRPTSAPEMLDVRRISDVVLHVEDIRWRLRTVRFQPSGRWVEFMGGRPSSAGAE
jgi:hypothetical protein